MAPDSVDLLRVTAQDINPVAVDMAYINLTLWGIPARVILGDTIRGTVTNQWRNVHWFRVGEEVRQLADRSGGIASEVNGFNPAIQLGKIREAKESNVQQLFDF